MRLICHGVVVDDGADGPRSARLAELVDDARCSHSVPPGELDVHHVGGTGFDAHEIKMPARAQRAADSNGSSVSSPMYGIKAPGRRRPSMSPNGARPVEQSAA
jgi:hypothetical protein